MSIFLEGFITYSRWIKCSKDFVLKCAGHTAVHRPVYRYTQQCGDDQQEDDLFGVTSRADREVVLSLETARSGDAKLRKGISALFTLLGFGSIVALSVLKGIKQDKVSSRVI